MQNTRNSKTILNTSRQHTATLTAWWVIISKLTYLDRESWRKPVHQEIPKFAVLLERRNDFKNVHQSVDTVAHTSSKTTGLAFTPLFGPSSWLPADTEIHGNTSVSVEQQGACQVHKSRLNCEYGPSDLISTVENLDIPLRSKYSKFEKLLLNTQETKGHTFKDSCEINSQLNE